jgi:tRNA-dihydrouridine synthase A
VPALEHGDVPYHLDFDPAEHPLALQLGGSDPGQLATGAKLGERWGYDEINLNCGCPSERVQTGSFGACLMAEPAIVADCVKAMRDAVSLPVTVKHRIGLNDNESYSFVPRFRRHGGRGGLRSLHRPRAQRGAEGPFAEGESRGPAAALRRRAAV